jgi:hypothetical protein
VSSADFGAAREFVDDAHARQAQLAKAEAEARQAAQANKKVEREKRQKKLMSSLSLNENLITPRDVSLYDLLITKASGKSGPLLTRATQARPSASDRATSSAA